MRSACFLEVSIFKAIICLYDFWLIAKMFDGHFDKFHTGVGRLLAEGVDKSLPTGFVNDRVLIELVRHSPYIAGFGNIFHVELPFYAQIFWCIVRLWHVGLLLCRFFLVEALLSKKTKKGAGMTLIAVLKFEFRVQFNEGDGWISPNEIFYPSFFLWCIGNRMLRFWMMRAVS